eukprot:SM000021S06442  [mRNA]  locus=s21:202898:203524:- [translate_table: standard]
MARSSSAKPGPAKPRRSRGGGGGGGDGGACRSRLKYEQFSSFLANIKDLNAHRQTKEDTLRKAAEIFGADNQDLYVAFEGLLTRNLPSH